MDKDQRVRNMLIAVLLCVQISTCNLRREAHARESDLQFAIGRHIGNMKNNSYELYFSLPGPEDHDVDMAAWGQSVFAEAEGEQFPCKTSVGNAKFPLLVPEEYPDIEKHSRPYTGHFSTAAVVANTSQSDCEKNQGHENESPSSILQRDISLFNTSRGNVVEKVNGGETRLLRTGVTQSTSVKQSSKPSIFLTDEKYMNISVCTLDDLNEDLIPLKTFQTLGENALMIYTKPNGYFSNIETTELVSAIDCYASDAHTLTHMSFVMPLMAHFMNISSSKCADMEARARGYYLHHPKDEVNFLYLSTTTKKDIYRSTQINMCDSEETQYTGTQEQNMLKYDMSNTRYQTKLENTYNISFKKRVHEFQEENEGIKDQAPSEMCKSNEQHSSTQKECPNVMQNYSLVKLARHCELADQVLENKDLSETDIPNNTQNLDGCFLPILPLYFSLNQCWNITVKRPEFHFKVPRDLSYSENSDFLSLLSDITGSGKENKSEIMECPIYAPRNPHTIADTDKASEAPTQSEFPVEGEGETTLCFPYTCGDQSKSILVHENSSSFSGSNNLSIGCAGKNLKNYGYSLSNSVEMSASSRETHALSPMRRKGISRLHDSSQDDFQRYISANEVDVIQYGKAFAEEEKISEGQGEADYEILNVRTDGGEPNVQMAWPLKVLVYSCSLLVIIWSMYGAAHLYRFYIEQRRLLSPRTPTSSYRSPGFPFHSDSMQAIVDSIKGDQVASASGGIFPTTPSCSPVKQPRCSTPNTLREKFQQLLHSDHCLGDRVELYAADNIKSMVRYDPGLGMKLWPHFKHNTRRYVGRTVQDRKITQYVEKKLQSRMLTDFAFQEDVFCYIEKHVWPEVRRQARMSIGDWEDSRLDFRSRDVMRGEALTFLSARFSTILWHDGLLEREIMSHVEQTRHGSMHYLH